MRIFRVAWQGWLREWVVTTPNFVPWQKANFVCGAHLRLLPFVDALLGQRAAEIAMNDGCASAASAFGHTRDAFGHPQNLRTVYIAHSLASSVQWIRTKCL